MKSVSAKAYQSTTQEHPIVSAIYSDLLGRENTTLTYEATYFPTHQLGKQHRIGWYKTDIITKTELLRRLNPDQTAARILLEPLKNAQQKEPRWFPLAWQYNNIPTQVEWEELAGLSFIAITYRVSPCIRNAEGRIAVLAIYRRVKLTRKVEGMTSE